MAEDWSRPAPPARERTRRSRVDDGAEHRDPWTVRIVDERRLRSRWSLTPFTGDGHHRLWREGGLVTIADGDGRTTIEGTATGAAVVREWAPWGTLAWFVLLCGGIWTLTDSHDMLLGFTTGLLFASALAVGQLRSPLVRLDLLDHEGRPRLVQLQPVPQRFGGQPVADCRALAGLLRADAVAAHPLAGDPPTD